MKASLVKEDSSLTINGLSFEIDTTGLPENFHALQWDGGSGHIEWTDKENTEISEVSEYQEYIDSWMSKKAEYDAMQADPLYGMTQKEKDAAFAEQQRKEAIRAARVSAGLQDITVDQAIAYITGQLDTTALDATAVDIDNSTDLATAKAAFKSSLIELRKLVVKEREVLLKMVPYLLS